MKIEMDPGTLKQFIQSLEVCEDAEPLGGGEYALDLYESNPPMTMEIEILEDGINVLAAAELAYDESMNGWYLEARIEDLNLLRGQIELFYAPTDQ